MAFTIDFKILRSSIVNTKEDTEIKGDKNEPYSFINFVRQLDIDNVNNDFVVDIYNRYLIEWSKIQRQPTQTFQDQRRAKYVELLKNIQLNFITDDERRILGNIDFNNPLELEVAIPFFVEKIKDIIVYYQNRRRSVKNSKSKWSTKGSLEFLNNIVAEYVIENYTRNEDTFQNYKNKYQELSSFQNDYELIYDGLYDLKSYRNIETPLDKSDFEKGPDDYVLSSLPITAFSDYNRSSSTLISELKKELYKKYVSTDQKYYGETKTVDIDSTTPFFDTFNHVDPFISRISTTDDLLTENDVGFYFTSKYIFASKYISPKGISLKDTNEFIGTLPLLDTYLSEDYVDFYLWSKYDTTYSAMANKPVTNKRLKRMHGYQSRDIMVDDTFGVERYTDDIQLWSGDKNEVWANNDIFEKFSENILNRDAKNDFYFNLKEGESVYKYSTDIFGNEYYLVKKKRSLDSSQNSVYPLIGFSQPLASANFILLGQRKQEINALSATEIQPDLALGFFIGGSDDIIETLQDYHVDDFEHYTLDNTRFNTETIPITSDTVTESKSIYEDSYSSGRLIVRTSDSNKIQNFREFIEDIFDNYTGLWDQLNNDIINVDVVNDLLIITTSEYILTTKIIFNFNDSSLVFSELTKNIKSFYNNKLHKTGSYWFSEEDSSVTFVSISADSFSIQPTMHRLFTEDNTEIQLNAVGFNQLSSFDIDYPIQFENISKPSIIKDRNDIYIVTMIRDICENYSFNVLRYVEKKPPIIELVSNTTYTPDRYIITEDILESGVETTLSSFFSTIQTNLSSDLVYYNGVDIVTEDLPTALTSNETYFDVDEDQLVTKSQPNLEYSISDVSTLVTSSLTDEEDSYEYDTQRMYAPSDLTIDLTSLSSFSTFIPSTDHIVKIEYDIDGKNISTNILSESVNVYDPILLVSPLNDTPLVYTNNINISGIKVLTIRLYGSSGKLYRFDFNMDLFNAEWHKRFTKVELLDARLIKNKTEKNINIYLNTRSPNFITTVSLINI